MRKKENRGNTKKLNTKNLPIFILIGLIAMIIIVTLIYNIFLKYSPEQILTYKGFAIQGKTLAESLKSDETENIEPYLSLIEINENDLMYKKLNSYYIGENEKQEIDIDYPMYINAGGTIWNLSQNTKLITVNYEEVEGYPEFMLTDGVMYNGIDLTRADGNKYIFLKSEDEIYTNVGPIKVETTANEYNITEYSNIYFTENAITYYELENLDESDNSGNDSNGKIDSEENNNSENNLVNKENQGKVTSQSYLKYKKITDIDSNTTITVNGETLEYKTFLEKLGVIRPENETNERNENTINEENTIEGNSQEQGQNETQNNLQIQNTVEEPEAEKPNEEQEWQEGMWAKPEINLSEFEEEVYTISTNITVDDKAQVITKGITFELVLDGRLNRRVNVTQEGLLEITGLRPETEYEIIGTVYYRNEQGEEIEEEFYRGKITTKPIDTLGTIDFSFENGQIYSNKIELRKFKIKNNLEEEVVKGISVIQVEIENLRYRLSNNEVDEIKQGKEITYATSETIKSNSTIKYRITAYDRYGNELKEINNEGETVTSKEKPTVSIRATKQDVTEVKLQIQLNNKDKVEIENYRYEVQDSGGRVLKEGALGDKKNIDESTAQETGKIGGEANTDYKEELTFTDLDPNGYYIIVIYGDFDLGDGKGKQENEEIGRGSFVTRPIASLGYMQVQIDEKEVTQDEIKIGVSIDENQTDKRLIAILDKVEIVVYDEGKNVEENIENSDESNDEGDNEENNDERNSSEATEKGTNSKENGSTGNDSSNLNTGSTNASNANSNNTNTNQNKNSKKDAEPRGPEINRIILTTEEVQALKTAEEIEINLNKLTSNTIYKIDVITTVKQGTVQEIVEDKQNIEEIITLKIPAEVQIRNQFVIGTMIDLDIRIEDPDNSILNKAVRIEIRDEDNKLVDLSEMNTNAEYERKVYENLEEQEEYKILIYAPQYNIGSTDATYHADYLLKEIRIVTEAGISGKLDLLSLEKTASGKNLIDVSSKVNWYTKCFNMWNTYPMEYDNENKIITIYGKRDGIYSTGYILYDLSKYLGQEVTISFEAKTEDNTSIQIAEKTNNNFNDANRTTYYTINNLTTEWQEYGYTVTLGKTGYIGLGITVDNATVQIQDLQIELGNQKTDYEEFKYIYNANVAISVNDARNEITTNDYYIRIYKNNEQIAEHCYQEIGEENKIENVQKLYEVEENANYKIELLVKVQDRYYSLDEVEFTTENIKEIKGIRDLNDYLKIQPYGNYIVLNNIDLTGVTGAEYRFGSNWVCFEGNLNFNGKTLLADLQSIYSLFQRIADEGIIENMVFEIKFNNEVEKSMYGKLTSNNYGTIRNIKCNITETTKVPNSNIYLISTDNYGKIENFIINMEEPIYVNRRLSLVSYNNHGEITNGYIYGKNIETIGKQVGNADIGEITLHNSQMGSISNIFTTISVNKNYEDDESITDNIGNIVVNNHNNAEIRNVYSVGIGENISNFTYGPNVYNPSSKKIYNNYYFADEIFTSELETKGNKLSLYDKEFQNQILNENNAFNVDEMVEQGYFPQLKMPECMPAQEYIELPEVENADLPDILSTKILEQGSNTVKVEFSVNNPSAATISKTVIENIGTVEIISQEYNNGKSTVIAELKNPTICVSSYDIRILSIKGAFGSTYDRDYSEGERTINVDLYREIWNVQDWKNIKNSPTENYMLMADLDFINEGNNIIINDLHGKLNGNNFKISNIIINDDRGLIRNVDGTLENLYVQNFNQEGKNGTGLVNALRNDGRIDNVHLKDVTILKTGETDGGGLVAYNEYGIITNSSITNIKIDVEANSTLNSLYVGGLVGRGHSASIQNSYVKNLQIEDAEALKAGIGGIIGWEKDYGNIENCYVEGSIKSSNIGVGGIIGASTYGQVKNSYSKVDISTTNSMAGGIGGSISEGSIENISNNISIGNIYSTVGIENINRIAGSSANTNENNYAYEKQLLNGYTSKEEKGATLLSKDEILNWNLGESYYYEEKEEGILPKLYNTEQTELLPNQENIYIEDVEETNIPLEIENMEINKPNSSEVEINIRLINSEEVEIAEIKVEDMNISISRQVSQNGITNLTLRGLPEKYYDSYKLTEIKYLVNDEEQVKNVEIEVPVQFYKEIYTFEDWQSIEEGTYQNYKLMADIDFAGKADIKSNVTINRLEADNMHYLKNISLEFNAVNTGLLQNIKTEMKNIGFENIKIKNNSSGSNTGILVQGNGNLSNINFKEIVIEAEKMSNIGIISSIQNGNIENIEIQGANIIGNAYVGGLTGRMDSTSTIEIENIVGDNINIMASSNYAGGLVGYQNNGYVINNNLKITNSNIIGNSYVGGIFGEGDSTNITNLEINNSVIEANNGLVGGIAGRIWNGPENRKNFTVNSCEINLNSGNNIGGIVGEILGNFNYAIVTNTNINAYDINSQNIGGMCGSTRSVRARYLSFVNSNINTNGSNIGGLVGATETSSSPSSIYLSSVINAKIEGNNNVGGLVGSTKLNVTSDLDNSYSNAEIKANNSTAGGLIGYIDNTNMTASNAYVRIDKTMVLDSTVTAPEKAGGLIGDIAKEIYRNQSFYYNNYIEADVNVTGENKEKGSLVIGGRPDENPYIENTYVYRYSKLNGNYVYATDDNIEEEQYLVKSDLESQNTYTGKIKLETGYWDYTPLENENYPKLIENYTYKPELQERIKLPTDPEIADMNSLNGINSITENGENDEINDEKEAIAEQNENNIEAVEPLPEVTVYPISVNEINVDFSNIASVEEEDKNENNTQNMQNETGKEMINNITEDEIKNIKVANTEKEQNNTAESTPKLEFTYYVNGELQETKEITEKTYTFKYNFEDELKLKITNGKEEKEIVIKPEEVISKISIVGENTAYIKGSKLYINGEAQKGEYVNVYEGKAMLKNSGQIMEIASGTITEVTEIETKLEQEAKPLHSYNYKENEIETYGTYSEINGNIKLQIYNVRNGRLTGISNNLNMKIDNIVEDNYNGKEYQTILSQEGELVDIKEKLEYPEGFFSRNIEQIEQNMNEEKPEMMVMYKTGKIVVFNYVTGEKLYETEEKADEGLVDYITGSISNIWNDYEDRQIEYEESQNLISKLQEMPIEEALKENKLDENDEKENIGNTIDENLVNTIGGKTENQNNIIENSTSEGYMAVYNGNTGEYEVYSENEIIDGTTENPVSETTKIKLNGLEGLYSHKVNEITEQVDGSIIVISIIGASLIALIILRKIIYKNSKKKK